MLAQRGVGLQVGRGHWIVAALGADLVAAIAKMAAQDFTSFQSRRARVLEFARELAAGALPRHRCGRAMPARLAARVFLHRAFTAYSRFAAAQPLAPHALVGRAQRRPRRL